MKFSPEFKEFDNSLLIWESFLFVVAALEFVRRKQADFEIVRIRFCVVEVRQLSNKNFKSFKSLWHWRATLLTKQDPSVSSELENFPSWTRILRKNLKEN